MIKQIRPMLIIPCLTLKLTLMKIKKYTAEMYVQMYLDYSNQLKKNSNVIDQVHSFCYLLIVFF